MPSNNRLKVCTFNAKCDELDNKCCVVDHHYSSESAGVPDSLKAVMLAITLLPCKGDIINVQNVDKCVVPHLLKELCRVKVITDRLAKFTDLDDPRLQAEKFQAVCDLNNLTGLCPDAVKFRDTLVAGGEIDCLNYTQNLRPLTSIDNPALSEVYKYSNIDEYVAYHNGCVLTLVKKSLNLCPEAKDIPCVDSLVLFFEYDKKRFINVNVNLGGMSLSVEGLGCKKSNVDAVVCWLKQYKDCGSFLVSGALGDLDYDIDQLLYRGDALIPEFTQLLTSKNIDNGSAPSSFPCDPDDPIYNFLEYMLKTCSAENIPYSWLLQYLRVNGYKKCCAYDMVHGKKECGTCKSDHKDKSHHKGKSHHGAESLCDRRKETSHKGGVHVATSYNRAHMRQQKADKCGPNGNDKGKSKKEKDCCKSCKKGGSCTSKKSSDCEDKCVLGDKQCIKKCECVCEDKCSVPLKKKCKEIKKDCNCYEKEECNCNDTPYTIKVDVCDDLCDKKCVTSKKVKGCDKKCDKKCKDVCDCDPCAQEECPPYCDTLSVLKRELCLWNTLNKVQDVNDRFTGFYDHFNRSLDCRYPRGIFQAWAMGEEYCLPKCPTRKIDNNSELLALDHVLVSDCIKNYVTCSFLSDFKLDSQPTNNALDKNPFKTIAPAGTLLDIAQSKVTGDVPDYSGKCLRSFFPNRVYCIDLKFPCDVSDCGTSCGLDLYALGLKSLWCALDRWGACEVDYELMKSFCLDTHPYFDAFFYNTLRNKFLDKTLQGRYDRAFGVCRDGDVALRFRKKAKITECEFYEVMTCAYTNTENKDRFVITIGFIEAIIRAVRAGTIDALHCDNINRLYDFLDICFSGKLKLREYLNSYMNITDGAITVDVGDLENGNPITFFMTIVAEIITDLTGYLIDNCRFMEVLIRRASEAFDVATKNGDILSDMSPEGIDEFHNAFIINNAEFLSGECTEHEIKANLVPNVCSTDSVRYLIEFCVKPEEIINFLMNVTISDV
jgi:hypothetical protein